MKNIKNRCYEADIRLGIVALGLILVAAIPVMGAETNTTTTIAGNGVIYTAHKTLGNINDQYGNLNDIYLSAMKAEGTGTASSFEGTDIYIAICGTNQNGLFYDCKVGHSNQDVLRPRFLNDIAIGPVNIELQSLGTGQKEDITLNAQWAGIENKTIDQDVSIFRAPDYSVKTISVIFSKAAIATLSITSENNNSVEYVTDNSSNGDYASMAQFKGAEIEIKH